MRFQRDERFVEFLTRCRTIPQLRHRAEPLVLKRFNLIEPHAIARVLCAQLSKNAHARKKRLATHRTQAKRIELRPKFIGTHRDASESIDFLTTWKLIATHRASDDDIPTRRNLRIVVGEFNERIGFLRKIWEIRHHRRCFTHESLRREFKGAVDRATHLFNARNDVCAQRFHRNRIDRRRATDAKK
jgi:hypothetical protein